MSNRRKARPRVVPSLSHDAPVKITGLGDTQRIANPHNRRDPDKLDPGPGAHQWVLMVTHTIADPERWVDHTRPDSDRLLDAETLLFTAGPLCWKCERPYSPDLGPCRGELR